MAFAKKKSKQPDPISDRARALNDQISSLEAQIKKLNTELQSPAPKPKLRTSTVPQSSSVPRKTEAAPAPKPVSREPVFEEIAPMNLQTDTDSRDRYNELGVRKYDLPALWERVRNHFRSPTTNNPRLVNYLAAGGVQGLRPMRYEKRVARNRVIALAVFFFVILLGTVLVYFHNH